MPKYYACLAADTVQSRRMRLDEVENVLIKYRDNLNLRFKHSLAVNFDVRKGDELIGVFSRFSEGYRAARHLIDMMKEDNVLRLHIGLGFGTIDTNSKNDLHRANGSVFINAVEARDTFIKKGRPEARLWDDGNGHAFFVYTDEFSYQAINSMVYTIRQYETGRTDKQRRIIEMAKKYPDYSLEEIGKKFGYKSPKSTISKQLARAHYKVVNEMEKSLTELLDNIQALLEKRGESR